MTPNDRNGLRSSESNRSLNNLNIPANRVSSGDLAITLSLCENASKHPDQMKNQREKPGPRDLIDLLILQPTPFCNIDCDYCYLPDRKNPKRMSGAVIDKTIQIAVGSGLVKDRLSIVWHAGEPLAVPLAFYEDAFERINARADGVTIMHSIQTNGTIIDQRWCDLFGKHGVSVGVSIDGPAFVHDRHRKDRAGLGTHARVMRGIEMLKANSIPFHTIAVVTEDSLPHADAIFEFFLNLGAFQVGFNIEELEGIHSSSTLSASSNDKVEAFFHRIYALQQQSAVYLPIREFDRAYHSIANVSGSEPAQGNQQNVPFGILSIDWDGNISTFSPELLGAVSEKYANFAFGNVETDDLSQLLDNPIFVGLATEIHAGVQNCAKECEYFAFCGGGAPANKFYENGDFSSTETMYCRHTIQLPVEIVLSDLEQQLGLGNSRRRTVNTESATAMNLMEGLAVTRRPRENSLGKLVQITES